MTKLRRIDWVVCAVAAGLAFGLLEGAEFVALREFPTLRATQKVPVDVFYVAPLVTLPVYLALGLALAWLVPRVPRLRDQEPQIAAGVFTGLGATTLLAGPGVLHWAAVLIVGLGVAMTAGRRLGPSLPSLTRAMARRWWLAPLLLVAAWGATRMLAVRPVPDRPAAAPASPNVLVRLLDTVRRDRMDGSHTLAPRLAALAARGVVFSNAWTTSSWSLPSQASLLTGRLPHEHGADWPRLALYDSVPTLAEYFRGRGYTTGAFSSNTSWITPEYLGRGFDRFVSYHPDNVWRRTMTGSVLGRVGAVFGLRREGQFRHAPELNAAALEFVDARDARPFFAYVCYMDVNRAYFDHRHVPRWRARPPLEASVAAYDAGLSRLDAAIGALLDSLEVRGVLDRTVIVVASDHGESFGEELGDRLPVGHGTSLFPEQAWVPMALLWPGSKGEVRGGAVGLASVAATVAELTGDNASPFASPGLLRAPGDSAGAGASVAFASLDYDRFSVRSVIVEPWQYVRDLTQPPPNEFLFDLIRDPTARHNLAGNDSVMARLRPLAARLPAR